MTHMRYCVSGGHLEFSQEKRMTQIQKIQFKEVCWSMLMRSDKWNNHCKKNMDLNTAASRSHVLMLNLIDH